MKSLIALSYLPSTRDACFSPEQSKSDLIHWGWRCRQQMKQGSFMTCFLGKIIDLGMSMPSGYGVTPEFGDEWAEHTERVWEQLRQREKSVLFEHYVIRGENVFKAKRLGLRPSRWLYHVRLAVDAFTEKKMEVSCGTLAGKADILRKPAIIF